jgi:hypothetical protein
MKILAMMGVFLASTVTQGGNALPLVLKRVKDSAELERRRPQNPVRP